MTRIVLMLFAIIVLPIGLSAKDIYVNAGGGSGKGRKSNPYNTLWKAISKAERGDVIHVAKGTYNGKGGAASFTIKIPNLTIVGGYNSSFTNRNPFKNFTILERVKGYRGDWTGLKRGIIEGLEGHDHSGLTIDGLVLNAQSRNAYTRKNTKINPKKSFKGALFRASSRNIKLRNSILLNPYGPGIYVTWQGVKNEVSNNFILNTFYVAVSTRSAQEDSAIVIKNNTILFSWFQPAKGGSWGIYLGRFGQTTIQDNVVGYLQTEGGEAGYAVVNGFANEDTIMKDNIFFQCQSGFYKYMDEDGKNLVIWKKSELSEIEEDSEEYQLSEASGNINEDPKVKPDKWYFGLFSGFVASNPGKLNMDSMNTLRRDLGLPLQAGKGSARSNWGMPYPLNKVYPNLVSKTGKGAKKISFRKYSSKGDSGAKKEYEKTSFDAFEKGPSKSLAGKGVQFKAGMGANKYTYLLKNAPRSDYQCVQLLLPGEKQHTRKYVYGYLLKGSKAYKKWKKYTKKAKKYNKKGGIKIKGTAWYLGNDNYSYPIGIIIDEIKK